MRAKQSPLQSVLKFFTRLFASDAPVAVEAKQEQEKRKEMKVRAETLALASSVGADVVVIDSYAPYKPAPGVTPTDVALMAQDDNPTIQALGWARGSNFHEGIGFLGYPYLAELAQRPEYRRISEIIAKEMTRKWITLQSVGGQDKTAQIAQLEDALKRYKVKALFKRAAELDGFFGRAHIFIDLKNCDDEELKFSIGNGSSALSKVKVTKGSLKALRIIEPIWAYPNAYNSNNPLADDYYKPKSWFVQSKLIHASRLLTFVGREVADLLKPSYAFGGLSMSQMAKPYIDNWLRTRQSVSDLVHSFTTFVLKTNMDSVLEGGTGDNLFRRLDMFNRTRDNRGVMAIDKEDEEFENVSASLAGLDDLQAQAQEQMSSVSGIPKIKLFGTTPKGLNANGDNEMRTFYDWIEAEQEAMFGDHLTKIINIIQLSEFGVIDPGITHKFNPLWALDDKELSDKRKTDAETDVTLIDAGIIDPQEARVRLAADEDSPYQSLDLTKTIEPPQDPAMMGGGEGMPPGMPPDMNPDAPTDQPKPPTHDPVSSFLH